jgi:hypothetical protein
MGKEKFIYNTHTLRYEKVEVTFRDRFLKAIGFASAVLVSGVLFTLLVWKFFPSPQEEALMREIDQMSHKYAEISEDFAVMSKVLDNIQERDASVHRIMFGMDPIDANIWNGGIGGHNKYSDIVQHKRTGEVLVSTLERVDKLKRQLKMQSESLDTIISMAQNREEMLASIPSIKPVRSDKLARNVKFLSGFGYRLHPVHKVRKMHTGIDFTAPKGTPIQATGNGVVETVEYKQSGYGYHVVINHGFGFKTLYGHMQRIDVRPGQKVKRGQSIGAVGNTGTSTAPHCHYEIILKGEKINPIHYCMDDLSPMEYQQLVEMASMPNQSLD